LTYQILHLANIVRFLGAHSLLCDISIGVIARHKVSLPYYGALSIVNISYEE